MRQDLCQMLNKIIITIVTYFNNNKKCKKYENN